MSVRFIKVSADNTLLAADAAEWAAVLDTTTNLMWDASEHPRLAWKKAVEFPKTLALCGLTDWRLPTVEELFLLADRTKFNPAIDQAFFPGCDGGWYWTSTVDASSPGDYAWVVGFSYGFASWGSQDGSGLVRAVRPRQ